MFVQNLDRLWTVGLSLGCPSHRPDPLQPYQSGSFVLGANGEVKGVPLPLARIVGLGSHHMPQQFGRNFGF